MQAAKTLPDCTKACSLPQLCPARPRYFALNKQNTDQKSNRTKLNLFPRPRPAAAPQSPPDTSSAWCSKSTYQSKCDLSFEILLRAALLHSVPSILQELPTEIEGFRILQVLPRVRLCSDQSPTSPSWIITGLKAFLYDCLSVSARGLVPVPRSAVQCSLKSEVRPGDFSCSLTDNWIQ